MDDDSSPVVPVKCAMTDERFETVLGTIQSIKNNAVVIGQELGEQSMLLNEMGNDMESTGGKITLAVKKVNEYYQSATDRRYYWVVGILIMLLMILLIIFSSL